MLLQFNVKNYLSFKNEVVLSLYANKNKDHLDHLIAEGKEKVLPVIAVYGANASGKTNLIRAINAAVQFIRRSNSMQSSDVTGMIPFQFDNESVRMPTKMDFVFICDGDKYEYGFEADSENVYEEYLYVYHSAKPSMIFERTNINQYKFSAGNKRELSQYIEKNQPNQLFLCTASAWNCQLTKDAFLWFSERIDTYHRDSFSEVSWVSEIEHYLVNPKLKEFALTVLKHAEINIEDFVLETRNTQNSGQAISNPDQTNKYRIEAVHVIKDENTGISNYHLPFQMESDGTKTLTAYAPVILNALQYGRTIIIDEIDTSLHPSVVKYLITLFNDRETNPNGAQLIMSSHDITQLDSDLFRRDQIYFTEKDNNTGITDLYSLADYSPRIGENILKGYLQGRYGALPFIRSGIEWQEEYKDNKSIGNTNNAQRSTL